MLDLVLAVNRPIVCLISTRIDKYRKPRPHMWHWLESHVLAPHKVNLDDSFYCGHNAGRPYIKGINKNEDYSQEDYAFAK